MLTDPRFWTFLLIGAIAILVSQRYPKTDIRRAYVFMASIPLMAVVLAIVNYGMERRAIARADAALSADPVWAVMKQRDRPLFDEGVEAYARSGSTATRAVFVKALKKYLPRASDEALIAYVRAVLADKGELFAPRTAAFDVIRTGVEGDPRDRDDGRARTIVAGLERQGGNLYERVLALPPHDAAVVLRYVTIPPP